MQKPPRLGEVGKVAIGGSQKVPFWWIRNNIERKTRLGPLVFSGSVVNNTVPFNGGSFFGWCVSKYTDIV